MRDICLLMLRKWISTFISLTFQQKYRKISVEMTLTAKQLLVIVLTRIHFFPLHVMHVKLSLTLKAANLMMACFVSLSIRENKF